MNTQNILIEKFGIKQEVLDFCNEVEGLAAPRFREVEEIAEYNQAKVLAACIKNHLSDAHFAGTTGYGFDDIGHGIPQ
jgi:cystathionine beta-lyase family protein involved in aluminum resistance